MGIKATVKTDKKATLRMYNSLSSYLFEEDCGELRYSSEAQKKILRDAQRVLGDIL